jgi:hypothetical protein
MRIPLVIAAAFCLSFRPLPSGAAPLQFDVKQISDEAIVSRDPSIGDASLIAWISSYTNETAAGHSAMTVLENGKRHDIDNPAGGLDSMKPQSFSNSLVWVGSFSNAPVDFSAFFAEVPGRDEGGATEVRAVYKIGVDSNDVASLVDVPTGTQFRAVYVTNELGQIVVSNFWEKVTVSNEIRRNYNGAGEVIYWTATGAARRITQDARNDFAPSVWDGKIAWQKAKGWPFGWEIFFWKDGVSRQLTTNFYYDMAPKVQGHQVVWYGWDGHDFEIYMYDQEKDAVTQITSNKFDDVAPVIWNGDIAWEGYQSAEADIFLYHTVTDSNGQPQKAVTKISDNPEDDINPRIWDGKVVWQGFDGDDFEIYYYDGKLTRKITANNYDDTNPDIRDGIVTWQGYKDNWDSEIFAWDITTDPKEAVQLTDNDDEDREPHTINRHIVWQQDTGSKSRIMLATPKK